MSAALNQATAAAGAAGASRIKRLTFKYAPAGHVTPEIIETLFLAMSSGTIAEGAHLVVEPQATTFHCIQCDRDFEVMDSNDACPHCQRPGLPASDTVDLFLESIDVDE